MRFRGDKIRGLRAEREITQAELAVKIGITQECLSGWELGKITNPRPKALRRLAKSLRLPRSFFLEPDSPDKVREAV